MHTLITDKQQRVRLPDAKPGQVFAYELQGGVILLHQVRQVEPEVEVLELDDLDPKRFAPRNGVKCPKQASSAQSGRTGIADDRLLGHVGAGSFLRGRGTGQNSRILTAPYADTFPGRTVFSLARCDVFGSHPCHPDLGVVA